MTVQNIQSNYGNATVEYARKRISTEESYRQILEKKLSKQDEVIQNGSTEEAIQLGDGAYTTEEWDVLLANFDSTMDDLREQMRAEHEKRYEQQLEKLAQAARELEQASIAAEIEEERIKAANIEYQDFSTSKYDVVADNGLGCFEIYNETGDRIGAFFYEDIIIKTDVGTGTQLLISEHGTASYDAMLLDDELITGFEKTMGIEQLNQEALEGFSLHRHLETGISYLVKAGDEGRGGRLLISTEAEVEALEDLSETYLTDYPNLVSNKEVAQINAVLEVLGLMQRTPNGIVSINRDGMAYNDNVDAMKNWALLFEGDYYETVFEFTKLHRVLETDFSDYKLWDEFFEENGIMIERIWSDQELEQGYLNN